jgi:hypothetical protein
VRVDEVWTMALRIDHPSATLDSFYFGTVLGSLNIG